jgi:hypothetical protein
MVTSERFRGAREKVDVRLNCVTNVSTLVLFRASMPSWPSNKLGAESPHCKRMIRVSGLSGNEATPHSHIQ